MNKRLMRIWLKVKNHALILREAFLILMDNDPLRLASSAAFYALFAIPPSVLLMLTIFGMFLDEEVIGGEFFKTIDDTLGEEVANNIFWVLRNLSDMGDHWWIFAGSMVIFAISATTLFIVVKNSINQIWNLMPLPENVFMRMLLRRAIALGIIFLGGVLSLITILTDTLLGFLSPFLLKLIPELGSYLFNVINFGLGILILTVWFGFLFKYLPDAKIKWNIVWNGAILTAILFNFGRLLMSYVFSLMNLNTIYGTTSSFIVLLLFIYYFAQIIFYGASFTRAYANYRHIHIRPNSYAMKFKIIEEKVDEDDHLEKI